MAKNIMNDQVTKCWMYRNARPLDLARWEYHFENGSREAVLRAMAAYQNEDGGFGHALEADSWNPNSAPIQTWCATELLQEIGEEDPTNPLIHGILRYLDSGRDFVDGKWTGSVPSNNDYPRAPWWGWSAEDVYDYNPTAVLAGFAIKFAEKGSQLYEKACRIAKEAAASFLAQEEVEGHSLLCFVRMHQYCAESGADGLFDMELYAKRVDIQIKKKLAGMKFDGSYEENLFVLMDAYAAEVSAPEEGAKERIAAILMEQRQADGTWDVPWSWGDYPAEWAISRNWWMAHSIVMNTRFLARVSK